MQTFFLFIFILILWTKLYSKHRDLIFCFVKFFNGEKFMGTGIIICGLNGAGKSTLGKSLAKKLNFYFIDDEDLYFPKIDTHYIYTSSRTHEEVETLFLSEIKTHKNFVFASGKADYKESIYQFFQYAILIDVPRDIRIQRVKKRSLEKFGNRMLSGGDLYEQEKRFLNFVKSRNENVVKEWVESLNCTIIRIDGIKTVEENVKCIIEQIQN